MRFKKYLVVLLLVGFLISCSSTSSNDGLEGVEGENDFRNGANALDKDTFGEYYNIPTTTNTPHYVLDKESVMDYDSLTKNYEFLGEWKYHIKVMDNKPCFMEFYNSGNKNTCYHVWKENGTMSIKEYKRDGNKYWESIKDKSDYYVITSNGELICYGGNGELQTKEELESYLVYITKIR